MRCRKLSLHLHTFVQKRAMVERAAESAFCLCQRGPAMFVFGHPDDCPDTKPGAFDSEDEAIQAAQAHYEQCPWDGLLAVWMQGGHIFLAVIYEGQVYRPE